MTALMKIYLDFIKMILLQTNSVTTNYIIITQ